jgi:hypothetical protein
MKKLIIILLILSVSSKVLGHQDFYVVEKFGNIQTRITTGYDYEQINIVRIIGKLANKLSEKLNYKQPIFLDFSHAYTAEIEPDYFLSFGKGTIKYTWTSDRKKGLLKKEGIVVRQVSHEFDIEATLKLIEYSITNIAEIKQNQKEIVYEQNYCQWKVPTIDTLKVKKVLLQSTSKEIEEVLIQKTYLNSDDWNFGVDYFYQNRKFHFVVKAYNGIKDTIALSIKNVFQIATIDSGTKIVFDSDSTFYCVGWYRKERVISKQHTIKAVKSHFGTFAINNLGDNLVSIHLSRFKTKEEIEVSDSSFYFEKTSIYEIENDNLTDDVKEQIKK